MPDSVDFLSRCRPGMTLRTVDRRDARIVRVDRAAGLIHGDVALHGSCRWHADGIWADAPCGARGPLDLAAPASDDRPVLPQRHASVVDALNGPNRHFCCD